jgi:type II secretory pathway component PulM
MAPERKSRTKAILIFAVVLVLTAIIAYFLHLRPAEEAVTQPGETQAQEEMRGDPAM